LVTDFNGKPAANESDLPMAGQLGGVMGVGVAANGDVWLADGTKNDMLFFPGGRIKDGRIVKVEGLKSPFGVAIDKQNRVWVSNSQSDTVVRFPANDPTKSETFRCGISVRGVALDSKGNLWAASNMSLDFPPPVIPDGVPIMEQFKIAAAHMLKVLTENPKMTTGVMNMIKPDGTQPAPKGFTGNGVINVAWGVSIDGSDDVWVGNFWGKGVVLMAGDGTTGHSAEIKTGDAIHQFQSGSIQLITDVGIDPAGNVWAANNWNAIEPVVADVPISRTSTWGGGSGLTVIYGVAAPVKPPLLGQVRTY
jgi:streptogramin lyase